MKTLIALMFLAPPTLTELQYFKDVRTIKSLAIEAFCIVRSNDEEAANLYLERLKPYIDNDTIARAAYCGLAGIAIQSRNKNITDLVYFSIKTLPKEVKQKDYIKAFITEIERLRYWQNRRIEEVSL